MSPKKKVTPVPPPPAIPNESVVAPFEKLLELLFDENAEGDPDVLTNWIDEIVESPRPVQNMVLLSCVRAMVKEADWGDLSEMLNYLNEQHEEWIPLIRDEDNAELAKLLYDAAQKSLGTNDDIEKNISYTFAGISDAAIDVMIPDSENNLNKRLLKEMFAVLG
jgi:hypothetical protein